MGIARAVVKDVQAGKVVQGGSTITQEVRNLYLSRERTFKRKLIGSVSLDQAVASVAKDRILTAYMNQVFYGKMVGIEAAAETYFSRTRRS